MIFLFVSVNIIKSHLDYIYHFSSATEFMLMFAGALAAMCAEILRYVDFLRNFDINKIYKINQSSKTIWSLYGIFYALWFLLISATGVKGSVTVTMMNPRGRFIDPLNI